MKNLKQIVRDSSSAYRPRSECQRVAALENACHSDDRKEEKSLAVGVVSRDSSRSTKGLGSE